MTYTLPALALLLAASFSVVSAAPLEARQDSSTGSANSAATWTGKSNGFEAKFYQSDGGNGSVSNSDFRAFAKEVNTEYLQPVVKNGTQVWPDAIFSYENEQVSLDIEPAASSDPLPVAELVAFVDLFQDFTKQVEGDVSVVEAAIGNGPEGKTFAHATIVAKGVAAVDKTPSEPAILN